MKCLHGLVSIEAGQDFPAGNPSVISVRFTSNKEEMFLRLLGLLEGAGQSYSNVRNCGYAELSNFADRL